MKCRPQPGGQVRLPAPGSRVTHALGASARAARPSAPAPRRCRTAREEAVSSRPPARGSLGALPGAPRRPRRGPPGGVSPGTASPCGPHDRPPPQDQCRRGSALSSAPRPLGTRPLGCPSELNTPATRTGHCQGPPSGCANRLQEAQPTPGLRPARHSPPSSVSPLWWRQNLPS